MVNPRDGPMVDIMASPWNISRRTPWSGIGLGHGFLHGSPHATHHIFSHSWVTNWYTPWTSHAVGYSMNVTRSMYKPWHTPWTVSPYGMYYGTRRSIMVKSMTFIVKRGWEAHHFWPFAMYLKQLSVILFPTVYQVQKSRTAHGHAHGPTHGRPWNLPSIY